MAVGTHNDPLDRMLRHMPADAGVGTSDDTPEARVEDSARQSWHFQVRYAFDTR